MATKITLPRRRFFSLKGGQIELAVGFLLSTILESGAARAADAKAGGKVADGHPAAVPADAAALLEALGGDAAAVKAMSVEELKALLTPEMLAQLDLGADFLDKLDTDLAEAIRDLEAAFRKKIVVAAHSAAKVDGDSAEHQDGETAKDGADDGAAHGGGGVPLIAILAGLAVGGGAIALAAGGSDDDEPANFVPVATSDSFTVAEDTAVTFDVRTNDTDANGDALTVTQINGTAITTTTPVTVTGGVVSLGADGKLTFTPTANYSGSPSFTYTISDGAGGTSTATVTGTVTAVNDAPVAVADTFTVAEDTPVTINVRANDTDADGDTLTVTAVNGTAITTAAGVAVTGGVVTLVGGSLVFTPTANYNGSPSFTYTVTDGKGGTATATVSGTVTAVNDAPVNTLPSDVATTTGATVLVAGLSISDPDGTTGTFTTTLSVASGTLSIATVDGGATVTGSGSGTVTITGTLAQVNAALGATSFTSAAGFSGNTTLTMTTSDGVLTDTDTLALNVGTVMNGVVQDGYISGATVFYDANGNGTYDDGEPLATSNEQGQFSLAIPFGGTGLILGSGGVNIDTGLANVLPLKAPIGSTVVNPLTTLIATLMESGQSVEEANLAVSQAFGLPSGIDYTTFDFLSDSQDPAIALEIQKVAAQIAQVVSDGVDAGLDAETLLSAITTSIGTGETVDLTSVDAIEALFVASGASAGDAAELAVAAAAVTQAIDSATSPDQISDVQGELNAPGANLPPVATTDTITATEDGAPVTVNLIANDVDPEGGAVTLTKINGVEVQVGSVVAVTGGTVTVGANGVVTFTPDADFNGTPSFAYTVADAAGVEQVGSVNVTVDPVNDSPTGSNLDATVPLFGAVILSPLATATDVDGDALSFLIVDSKGIAVGETIVLFDGVSTVTLNADGTLTFVSGSASTITFSYTISDGQDGLFTGLISVTPATDAAEISVTAAQLASFIDNIDAFPSVESIVVDGDGGVITVAQGSALLRADVTLAGDSVDIALDGGNSPFTLAELQEIGVDTVSGDDAIVIEVGRQSLVSLGEATIPTFAAGRAVTLEIASGALDGTATEVSAAAANLVAAGFDTLTVPTGETLTLTLEQADALAGSLGIEDFADVAVAIGSSDVDALLGDLTNLGALGIDHIDVVGDDVTITESQAAALAGAGIDFVDGDNVTIIADGTQLNTTLKGLSDLGVDSVAVEDGVTQLFIDAGSGLGSISLGRMAAFNLAQTDGSLDVTVNVDAGTLDSGFDLGDTASGLAAIGVDQIGVVGDGALTMNYSQVSSIADAGLTFDASANITITASDAQVSALAADGGLASLNIDTIDVADDSITITETQAAALASGNISFADGDAVTVISDGTQLNTSLKGLADLGVDSVAVTDGVSVLSLGLGGSLDKISLGRAVSFTDAQSDASLDVTVTVDGGKLAAGFDTSAIAGTLAASGVDHIGVTGDGALTMNYAQANAITEAGLTFDAGADITVTASVSQIESLDLVGVGIDHIDANGAGATITDATAAALSAGGTDFVQSDVITVTAVGTELTTTLKGLQDLHVDKVAVETGVEVLHVDAGDLSQVEASDLPQFDVSQSDTSLDVTLRVSISDLSDLDRLGTSLSEAGIDHFGLDADPASYSAEEQASMASITAATGITFVQDSASSSTLSFSSFLTTSTDSDDSADTHASTEPVEILDGAAASLFESGMLNAFTADSLVVDATDSGQYLATTLRDIADYGIDQVHVESGSGPVYVQFGALSGDGLSEIQSLFNHLTSEGPSSIFSGNDQIALVVDAQVADALSQIEGAFDQLASIGFTEVDVLGGDSHAFASDAIDIKVIGEDDDLFHQLAHDR
ncbi:beta strand repeat-containing protein [Sphingomonas hengshuiensis]|uniref:Cadherin domain-containing protein n=1 Tax=Sphingomonas hengshuiensis TaxID=1609977 RepID=A0A7U4J9B2_9SPHN|nr:cadherin-like domain-containing protein [Sphingomonas hengshuiensis]AJP72617.1 hypothetical protein TS85_13805 [Sphingomonas hengshuiensis]